MAGAVFALTSGRVRRLVAKVRMRASEHAPGSEEHEIEQHILETQVPAGALGIRVAGLDGHSLSLSAPLNLNKNVHGTAFAGSLYAVSVLSAWYLSRSWARREGFADAGYEFVAKAGSIDYKRPLKSAIVARSDLPSAATLAEFRATLERDGKAFMVKSELLPAE